MNEEYTKKLIELADELIQESGNYNLPASILHKIVYLTGYIHALKK